MLRCRAEWTPERPSNWKYCIRKMIMVYNLGGQSEMAALLSQNSREMSKF